MDEHRLGALLLENSFLREEELDRCLEIQELVGGIRPLGQILIEQGLLSKDSLDDLLTLQAQRRETAAATEVDAEDLVRILDAAVAASVEEIILSEGRRVMVRVACQLQPLTSEPINRQKLLQFLRIHMGEDVPRQLEQQRFVRQDFVKAGVARGRMVAFCHADGLGVVVRLHPTEPRQFSELGLDDEIAAIAQANQGLILVVGEKRSGVTETLGSLLHLVAQQENRVVLVLDENLEYAVPEAGSFVIRRRVGEHTEDYSTGLGSAFDQDADIVIVGDASGPGVFEQCLRAAEAGRLVIAALPAKSVGQALSRSLSFYPPREAARARGTIASVLRAVLAVQLLPSVNLDGQVMATELLLVDDVVREVIREGALSQVELLIRLGETNCGHSMDSQLVELLAQGRIMFHDALSCAEDKRQLLSVKKGGETHG